MSHRDHSNCGGDAAAYVLGALEPHEADAFRVHLESCIVCRDEVAAFGPVVEQLPMAATQQPVPRGLRRRVRRAIRTPPSRPRRPLIRRSALAVVTGLSVAAAGIVAGLELSSGGAARGGLIQAAVIGSSGSAQLRVSGSGAELVVRRFPSPPRGKIYEVWLGHARKPPSPTSALFSVTATGSGDVAVPGNLHGVSEVLVTPEPDGGSLVPTHPPVIVARLPAT